MKYPNLIEEKKLWKQGYALVAGLDEVGRGPLAGPVVACAALVKVKSQKSKGKSIIKWPKIFENIRDSKKMTAKSRENVFEGLKNHPAIEWGIGMVSEGMIDQINILEATKLAMKKAVKKLEKKTKSKVSFAILDGNFKIDIKCPQMPIIKGDEKVLSCSVASIMAKVCRDRLMLKYHKKYPVYGFDRHKGYGTKLHYEMINKHGLSEIHRKTFLRNLKSRQL